VAKSTNLKKYDIYILYAERQKSKECLKFALRMQGKNLIFHFGIIVAEVFSKLEDAPFIASSITLSLSIAHRS
jgi:hypothetical protein